MTKRDFLRIELLKELDANLKRFSYQLNKSLAVFTKNNKDGWFKYQIVFLKADEGWELKPSLLLRINSVEDIFHEVSEFAEKYKKGTPTIGTSIENYQIDGNYRYILSEEEQINNIAKQLFLLFLEIALPFFEKYNSLERIDKALNIRPEDTSLTGDIFKGLKALIVAKLINRDNYKELKEIYLNYYRKFSNGFYLSRYLNLVKLLEKY